MHKSLDPDTIWSERFVQIGTLIESSVEPITARWLSRAREEQPNAEQAHLDEMRDGLPTLLQAMGRALAHSAPDANVRHSVIALEHGEQRWKAGWRLSEVVRDYQIMRLVILDYLDGALEEPLQVREMMAVGLALDEAISASVISYVGHQEHQLQQANERLTEFLAVLGHELRNPLNAIVTTLQLVQMQQPSTPPLDDAFGVLDRQVGQMTRLLDDMLDVSRVSRNKLELVKDLVVAQSAVQRAVQTVHSLLATRGHALRLSLPSEPIRLYADPVRLEQVFTNLLTNAAKYTPPNGEVRFELFAEDEQAVFRVSDNGVGIAPHVMPQIFEMFNQAPEHERQGLGIGLALVRTLVQLHHGTIEVHSEGPGRGSEFTVRLPMRNEPIERRLAPPPQATDTALLVKRYSLLLIDDQVDGLQELALLLRLFGHQVRTANNGAEGILLAQRVRPDVILIDLSMPDLNGFDTAKQLRAESALNETVLVAMTGYPEDADHERSRAAGFDAHLTKPISFKAVQGVLASGRRV